MSGRHIFGPVIGNAYWVFSLYNYFKKLSISLYFTNISIQRPAISPFLFREYFFWGGGGATVGP